MRKLFILTLFALCSVPSWATWTLIQHPTKTNCTINTSTCTITLTQALTAGTLVVVHANPFAAALKTISSASNNNTANTYSLCSALGTVCGVYNAIAGGNVDYAYVLNANGGATTVTVNLSGLSDQGAWIVGVMEFSYTGSPISVDTSGNRNQSTNATSVAGVTLTLTGTNDVIIQGVSCGQSCSAISGGYSADFPLNNGMGWLVNTASGTAPNWTQSPTGQASLGAIAFKESGAAATPAHRVITVF